MTTISYIVTVCNEHTELDRLLTQLVDYKRPEDEIIVQVDQDNFTREVENVLGTYWDKIAATKWFPLNGDFATFKNQPKYYANGDYVVYLDADEYLTDALILNLGAILEANPQVDIYLVPRINTVEGLTDQDVQNWGWKVNEKGFVNYPDVQSRICRNVSEIKWIGKVHERLIGMEGYNTITTLPEGFELIHPKDIEKQRKQNNYYNTL